MSQSPAIRNWQAHPPPGSWALEYSIGEDHKWLFQGTPEKIVNSIAELQKANKIFEGYGKIWDWANGIWTERDPARALPYTKSSGERVTQPTIESSKIVDPVKSRGARVTKPCSRC